MIILCILNPFFDHFHMFLTFGCGYYQYFPPKSGERNNSYQYSTKTYHYHIQRSH